MKTDKNSSTSLFLSETYLRGIMIVVFKTDYALTFKSFNKKNVNRPTIYFVSDTLDANDFAEKISYYCSYEMNFKPISGAFNGRIEVKGDEVCLTSEEIEELYHKGFNPLKRTPDGFCIWGQQLLGATTEHGEKIINLPNYIAYQWAMKPEKPFDKADRFITLAVRDIIEIGHDSYTFSPWPIKYMPPTGIRMTPGCCNYL